MGGHQDNVCENDNTCAGWLQRAKYAQRAVQYVQKRIGWKYVAGMHLSLYSSMVRSKKREESSPGLLS